MIAKEVLSTEERYVEQLESLHKIYYERLKSTAFYPTISDLFTALDVDSVRNLNGTLLTQLRAAMEKFDPSTTPLGSIFVSLAPFFKLYIQYAKSYHLRGKSIESEMQNNPEFAKLIEEGKTMEKAGLDLFSLMITPIQRLEPYLTLKSFISYFFLRIPRYELLLRDLLKNTPQGHPDYNNIEKALNGMLEVNKLINTRVGENESNSKLAEVEELRKYVAPHRKLLESFGVKLRIVKKKVKGQMYIFNDILVIILSQIQKLKVAAIAGTHSYTELAWPMELLWLNNMQDEQFELIGPDNCFFVKTEVSGQKDKLFSLLEKCHQTVVKDKNLGSLFPSFRA